jgi:hypothetical protein
VCELEEEKNHFGMGNRLQNLFVTQKYQVFFLLERDRPQIFALPSLSDFLRCTKIAQFDRDGSSLADCVSSVFVCDLAGKRNFKTFHELLRFFFVSFASTQLHMHQLAEISWGV